MGGVWGLHAESWSVLGFDEDVPGGAEQRLAAVVVRQFTPPPRDPPLRAALSFLREVVRRPTPPASGDFHRLPAGWDAASDHGGEHEVLFSRGRRVVRVQGQDYPLPEDGSTLAVLVDERVDARVSTRTHLLHASTVPKPSPDPTDGKDEVLRRCRQHNDRTNARWRECVMADAVVASFLAQRA
jgi:hypothetical protein